MQSHKWTCRVLQVIFLRDTKHHPVKVQSWATGPGFRILCNHFVLRNNQHYLLPTLPKSPLSLAFPYRLHLHISACDLRSFSSPSFKHLNVYCTLKCICLFPFIARYTVAARPTHALYWDSLSNLALAWVLWSNCSTVISYWN